MRDDICGAPTADDTACQHPPSDKGGDPGRCWVPAHNSDPDDQLDGGGAPSKFDDEAAEAAFEAARQSKSKAGCARAAGVDPATLQRWVERNPTLTDGREFRKTFARARRDGETVLVQGGLRNDEVDTSMAKFLLATSFDYVKKQEIEHSGDAPVPVYTEAPDDETLRALLGDDGERE